ncbi:hypothetical protein KC331_g6470, partial [Hortaea werneckii]
VDYSVRPEKAAKLKRNKTSNASARVSVDHAEASETKAEKEQARPSPEIEETQAEKISKNSASGNDPVIQELRANSQAEATSKFELDSKSGQSKSLIIDEKQPERPSSKHRDRSFEDEIKVHPTRKPTPASKKPSRAKTTLYEDHLDHDAAQRTPSLSQQQAHRKRAFRDITNQKSTSSPQHPEQSIVDQAEEEDELARDSNAPGSHGEKSASQASGGRSQHGKSTKKRGRGRPPKQTPTQRDRSVEKASDASEAEEDVGGISGPDDEETPPKKKPRGRPPKKEKGAPTGATGGKQDHGDEGEAIESNDNERKEDAHPGKKGRGRPPRVVVPVQPEQEKQSPVAGEPSEESTHAPNEPHEKETGLGEPLPDPTEANTSANQAPTPSPEKSAAGKSTPPPNRASPTSHSPIKSNSKVPYRVGLSKRQKIPSLLRTMRPPKRPT